MNTKLLTTTVPANPETSVHSFVPTAKPPAQSVLNTLSGEDRELLFQMLTLPCEYVDHADFAHKNIEKRLFGEEPAKAGAARKGKRRSRRRGGAWDVDDHPATLNMQQEQLLFQRFNYARFRVYGILWAHAGRPLSAAQARALLLWSRKVRDLRAPRIQINVPLVLAMAKRTRLGGVDFGDLVSEGNMALLRAVDKFNCSRGFKFSTYGCRAILKSFSRVAMRTSRYRGMFPTEFDPTLEKSDFAELQRDQTEDDCVGELRDILFRNLARLSDVEQTVIRARFAIHAPETADTLPPKTLEQVGNMIGVTKERVRQIQNKALRKIRHALEDGFLAA